MPEQLDIVNMRTPRYLAVFMMKNSKTFDCVTAKRKGAEKVMSNLRDKNAQEQLHYWAKGTKDLKSQQERLRKQDR